MENDLNPGKFISPEWRSRAKKDYNQDIRAQEGQ